ncbi:hypothetical protein [Nocardioides nanhaiensis]|uniref:Lipoprotein n=1 Tax=Nocardioides nanhaiensis TaxID=1476871 RepID=A0ABP8WEG5_9ACTN
MTRRTTALPTGLAALALCLALAGCGGQDDDDAATDPASSQSPSETPSETPSQPEEQETEMPGNDGAGGAAQDAAIADLAQRLGVAPEEVTVTSSEAVTWRDGSLGCSEPGMMYTQALVEGTRIVLESGGTSYEYHAGGNRAPFLCEKPTQ